MKIEDVRIGLLVCKRDGSFWGEIVNTGMRGLVVVLSYFDDCNHYINLRRLVEPSTRKVVRYEIEPDNGQYHAYIPFFKGCHTAGDTKDEAYQNLKYAIHAYIRSMRKYGEVKLNKGRWDSWYYPPPQMVKCSYLCRDYCIAKKGYNPQDCPIKEK